MGRIHLLVDMDPIVVVVERDFVKVALDVDEALAFGLGHREERVHHDDRGHHSVAEESAVESAALRCMINMIISSEP